MGIGGIGINAVRCAVHAGASVVVAVDPVPFKREATLRPAQLEMYRQGTILATS